MWLVAMIGACLFKRIIQGAKGLEQIPLIDWYKEFGNLEAVSVCVRVSLDLYSLTEPCSTFVSRMVVI